MVAFALFLDTTRVYESFYSPLSFDTSKFSQL